MTMNAKRIFATGVATICLGLGGAGVAVADPSTPPPPGPCMFGPPGQLTRTFAQDHSPPGQTWKPGLQTSSCTRFFHGPGS